MDKREHLRFESKVEAKLISSAGSSHQCHVADFSQEGFRVYWDEDNLTLNTQDTFQLYLTLEDAPLNVSVLCLYQEGKSGGFKLTQPNNELFLKLQGLNQASRNSNALSSEKRSHYKTLFEQRVKETSQGLIKQWHSEVLEELFANVNKTLPNDEQQTSLGAEQRLKDSASTIQTTILTAMQEQLS